MIEYQNIFTTVQVAAPDYAGVPVENTHDDRTGVLTHSYLMGKLGDAQIGPIYLALSVSLRYSQVRLPSSSLA